MVVVCWVETAVERATDDADEEDALAVAIAGMIFDINIDIREHFFGQQVGSVNNFDSIPTLKLSWGRQ